MPELALCGTVETSRSAWWSPSWAERPGLDVTVICAVRPGARPTRDGTAVSHRFAERPGGSFGSSSAWPSGRDHVVAHVTSIAVGLPEFVTETTVFVAPLVSAAAASRHEMPRPCGSV